MRIEQLRFLYEIVNQQFNISRAADALHTAQPGVSKQIRLLERELGFEILRRHRGRITGLTEPGEAVLQLALPLLRYAKSIEQLRDDFVQTDTGTLTIATTHVHAHYVLPRLIQHFRRRYPRVQLNLAQVNPRQPTELVVSGRADLGIVSEPLECGRDLVQLPCYRLERCLIGPRNHPIWRVKPVSLAALARYPLIAYDRNYSAGLAVYRTFEQSGITPHVVLTAMDSEVIKEYVRVGLGIAVLPSICVDQRAKNDFRTLDVTHLFGAMQAFIVFHRARFLRKYMYDLIQMIAPKWTRTKVKAAIDTNLAT